jgi:hypothetical protein
LRNHWDAIESLNHRDCLRVERFSETQEYFYGPFERDFVFISIRLRTAARMQRAV